MKKLFRKETHKYVASCFGERDFFSKQRNYLFLIKNKEDLLELFSNDVEIYSIYEVACSKVTAEKHLFNFDEISYKEAASLFLEIENGVFYEKINESDNSRTFGMVKSKSHFVNLCGENCKFYICALPSCR